VYPSTKYYYKVSALNSSGEGSQSSSVSVTTSYLAKPSAPTGLTVTSHTSSAVALGWTASDTAASYNVYRSLDNVTYTTLATGVTATAYTDSTVSSMTNYYYKVSGVNVVGESDKSSYVSAYPVITLDGILSSSEYWTNTAVASTSSDSITSASYDISNLYVTNDATNLYIAIKFASAPKLWKDYRVTILLDNKSVTTGSAATTTATWNTGAATALTIAAGSVEAQITTYGDGGTVTTMGGGSCGTSWSGSDSSGYTPATAVLEYSIPLSSVGSLTSGNIVYTYAAVSEYTWGSAAQAGIVDHIPASAGTLTYDSTWPNYEADSVNMTNALAYTVK
jgi:Fibronectin type 3 domain-containing protein